MMKEKIQSAIATVIKNAGYERIANDVKEGYDVERNVKYFLSMFKMQSYRKLYDVKDGMVVRKSGKIQPRQRKLYKETKKKLEKALKVWKKY